MSDQEYKIVLRDDAVAAANHALKVIDKAIKRSRQSRATLIVHLEEMRNAPPDQQFSVPVEWLDSGPLEP